MLKKIVAWAIALTLSGQPVEAKTYEKQEFPTEMVANVPWEISPMTENIEQTNNTNYIKIAKIEIRKYYPNYEEYFKNIFNSIKIWSYEEYIINKEINRSLKATWELLKSDKDIITMILISLEKIVSNIDNFREKIWINKENDINILSDNIHKAFYRKYSKYIKNLENFGIEINNLTEKMGNYWIEKVWDEYITLSEKYMTIFKERLLDYGYLKEGKSIQEWIKKYIEILDKNNRKPSQIWQKYINEYNKIKN